MKTRRHEPAPQESTAIPRTPAIIHITPPPLPRPGRGPTPAEAFAAARAQSPEQAVRHDGATLEISDGTTLKLQGPVIIGRKPTHPDDFTHVLVLPDHTRTLSRDHLALGLTSAGQAWVEDQGSANGSYIARGYTWTQLPAHERIPVSSDDIIRFADFSLRIHTAHDPDGTESA